MLKTVTTEKILKVINVTSFIYLKHRLFIFHFLSVQFASLVYVFVTAFNGLYVTLFVMPESLDEHLLFTCCVCLLFLQSLHTKAWDKYLSWGLSQRCPRLRCRRTCLWRLPGLQGSELNQALREFSLDKYIKYFI